MSLPAASEKDRAAQPAAGNVVPLPVSGADTAKGAAPESQPSAQGFIARFKAIVADAVLLWRPVDGPRAEEANAIRLAQVRAISARTPFVSIANMMNSAIIALACGAELPAFALGVWLALMWSTSILRLYRWHRSRSRVHSDFVSPQVLENASIGTLIGGCLWGAAAFVIIATGSPMSQVLIVMTIAGMSAGSAAMFGVLPESVATFVVPAVGGTIAAFLLDPSMMSIGMVVMCTAFMVFMLVTSLTAYANMVELVRGRLSQMSAREELAAAYGKVDTMNQQMNEELEGARDMQRSLLPEDSSIHLIEKHWGVRIAHHFEPSLYIGGDLWYLLPISKDLLGVCVVDFTGHGVRAAINTFRLHATLQNLDKSVTSASDMLEELNKHLYRILPRGQMATAIVAIVDKSRDLLTYAAAGSPAPLIHNPADDTFTVADGSGLPLAAVGLTEYEERVLPFPPGASLVLYSDALIEFRDADGNMPGEEWLVERAEHHLRDSAQDAFLGAILADFEDAKCGPAGDDLTIVHLWRPA